MFTVTDDDRIESFRALLLQLWRTDASGVVVSMATKCCCVEDASSDVTSTGCSDNNAGIQSVSDNYQQRGATSSRKTLSRDKVARLNWKMSNFWRVAHLISFKLIETIFCILGDFSRDILCNSMERFYNFFYINLSIIICKQPSRYPQESNRCYWINTKLKLQSPTHLKPPQTWSSSQIQIICAASCYIMQQCDKRTDGRLCHI